MENANKGAMMVGHLVTAVVLALLGVLFYRMWVATPALPGDLGGDDVKAVFLTDGQVYFGEIEAANKDFLLIKNPYYLTQNTVLQEPLEEGQEAQPRTSTSLTELGGEGLQLHEPEKEMYVRWEMVKYIENLQDDSRVVELIEANENGETTSSAAGTVEAGSQGAGAVDDTAGTDELPTDEAEQ